MISDARGGHVSPGVYTEEKDVVYSAKSLGITSLGLVGETLKGPAFQPIAIEDWADFVDYFGGTSPEKYKGSKYPKYELPYIAKSYLSESRNLHVCRVLGLSGYNAGKAHVISFNGCPVIVLRSKGSYTSETSTDCESGKYEIFTEKVTSVTIDGYTYKDYSTDCTITGEEKKIEISGTVNSDMSQIDIDNLYKLCVVADDVKYNISLNAADRDYVYNIFSNDPNIGSANIFVEAVFDKAFNNVIKSLKEGDAWEWTCASESSTDEYDYNNYLEPFRAAITPWIVSEVKYASTSVIEMKKLFRVYTISDGNASNFQIKVSIQNIKPEDNTFDIVVRDFYDSDVNPVVLEKFSRCSMIEGTSNYVGLKVGTIDGLYENKSKYIALEINDVDGVEDCVPCGFLGYPMPKYYTENGVEVAYNTLMDVSVKPKRQYFGLNSEILDEDILTYKGCDAYTENTPNSLTKGFHLDAIINQEEGAEILVDGVTGFKFTTVNSVQGVAYSKLPRILTERYMEDTIYGDINMRKFTVYPCGGFDGWDIYRTNRTNTNNFKATQYKLVESTSSARTPFSLMTNKESKGNMLMDLKLPSTAINSDYYAFLGGYNQFANPHEVDINVFATPGIDFVNNSLLMDDVIDMIEDQEDGRGGDALYIFTTPQVIDGEDMSAEDAVRALEDSDIDSSYATTYFPWVKFYDSEYKMYLDLPVTKDVVRNLAATDNTSFPWFAPAGMSRGNVDCVRAYKKTTLAEEDTLYDGRINPVKTFGADGVKIWGNKTAYSKDTPLNRVNVRRLMIRVKKLVVSASKSLIFEQYDATLEKQFRGIVEPILSDVQSNRGIADYRVITENTAETRDQHILPAKILIKPINALEYISISFTVYPESVSFDE